MRWLLNVSAENRNSKTGSGFTVTRQGTSTGAGSRRGAWLRSPAFTSSRNTVRRSSSSATPSAPATRLTTVAKTSGPVPPYALAGEHASRQRHRRHHARVAWTAVGPQLGGGEARQEIEREPARRQRIALAQLGLGSAQRQAQQVRGERVQHIGRRLR